jgi:hypothetical protein
MVPEWQQLGVRIVTHDCCESGLTYGSVNYIILQSMAALPNYSTTLMHFFIGFICEGVFQVETTVELCDNSDYTVVFLVNHLLLNTVVL